ncbi:MAG: GIY-YIG nuclease family protein [Deltaproteobacteria bacterium]|nr:GIY-YIG nuclease family protein [Deltaproteobacteria bacterium]
MHQRTYFAYIMSSLSRTLYTGVTNDLERRVFEHKEGRPGSFTARYNVNRLVYFEEFGDINQAITRENAIKSMTRRRKIELIESMNPDWQDLSQDWQEQDAESGTAACGRPERSEESRRGRSSFAPLRTARAASRARHARE